MRELKRAAWLLAMMIPAPFAMGCMEVQGSEAADNETVEGSSEDVNSENGLNAINGLNSLNGLNSINGLNTLNGLNTINGLSTTTGLMTTTEGRATVSYMVKCALAAGDTLVKGSYTFSGQLGLAPEWKSGACGTTCQENISACMLAHVNTAGRHYPLWLIGPQSALGWGRNNGKPFIESAFFGNIFLSPPRAYYCNGPDYDRVPVAGRIGAEEGTVPFRNPFSGYGLCNDNCSSNSDGYTSCSSYSRPITVYRELDTGVPYRICETDYSTSCLESYNGIIRIAPRSNVDRQKFYFERVSTTKKEGHYRIKAAGTTKYISVSGGSLYAGAGIITESSSTSTAQRWSLHEITKGSFVLENARSLRLLDDRNAPLGYQCVQDGGGGTYTIEQQWKLTLEP